MGAKECLASGSMKLPDVTHHHVYESVFDEREKDKKCAGGHEHVNGPNNNELEWFD